MSDDELVIHARNREALCLYAWHPLLYNPQLKQWLGRIRVPTLVLWGASDRVVTPDYGRAYAGLIPGARFSLIDAAGHHPEIEQPERFRRAGPRVSARIAGRRILDARAACAGKCDRVSHPAGASERRTRHREHRNPAAVPFHRARPDACPRRPDRGAPARRLGRQGRSRSSRPATPADDITGSRREGFDFQNLHRNKRSLALNLKSPDGLAIFMKLAEKADVIVENFRSEVKFRLGIDYECGQEDQPAHRLRQHLRLRPERAVCEAARGRPDRPGHGRA